MGLDDPLVKKCARCEVTRSKKFFVTRRGDYSAFCSSCRRIEKQREKYQAQKRAYKKFTGLRYGLPYPPLLKRMDDRHEVLYPRVVACLNAFAQRAVGDALKRISSSRANDRKTTAQRVLMYKDMVLTPLLIDVREQIKAASLDGRKIIYPMWLVTPEQLEGARFGFQVLSGTTRVKQLAGLDEYEPDPRILALNNALDLPNREVGLAPENRALLYDLLWNWCDRQRLKNGLSPEYREKISDDGIGPFVKPVKYGRKKEDEVQLAARRAWKKIPDVILAEPGMPVEHVGDVEKRINEMVKEGVLEAMPAELKGGKAWWQNERVILDAFGGFDPTGFVEGRAGGIRAATLNSYLFSEAGGSKLGLTPSKKYTRFRPPTKYGRPTIEQTLCRAYIDMRINEETMWAMFPEHFEQRGGLSV